MRRFTFHYGDDEVRAILSDPTPSLPSGNFTGSKVTDDKVQPLQPGLSTVAGGAVRINYVPSQAGKHGRVEIDAGELLHGLSCRGACMPPLCWLPFVEKHFAVRQRWPQPYLTPTPQVSFVL